MTIHSLLHKLTELFTWLYYRHQWEKWELLAATGAVLLALLWAAKKHRNQSKIGVCAPPILQGASFIGAGLSCANHKQAYVAPVRRQRLAFLRRESNCTQNEAKQSLSSTDNTGQLRQDGLDPQLDELRAANEELQDQIAQSRKTEQQLRRRMTRLLAAGKKMRQERSQLERAEQAMQRKSGPSPAERFRASLSEPLQAGKRPAWSPFELLDPRRLSRCRPNPQQAEQVFSANPNQPPDSRRAKEPLDVEKLKALAALAKQIQSRRLRP